MNNKKPKWLLGMELKFLDCAWNGVTINTSTDGSGGELQPSSGCTDCISCPAQGTGESERDGRKYVIKSVWVSGTVNTTAAMDQADAFEQYGYFFALVLDTQCNGATVNSEDVYTNPSTLATAMMPKPMRNLQNSKRFKILDCKFVNPKGMYSFNDAAATGSVNVQVAPTVNLNWKGNIKVETDGTTANVSSVTNSAIHVLAFRGGGLVSTFDGKSRVRFMG